MESRPCYETHDWFESEKGRRYRVSRRYRNRLRPHWLGDVNFKELSKDELDVLQNKRERWQLESKRSLHIMRAHR